MTFRNVTCKVRSRRPLVHRHAIVWFSQAIKMHVFITWLVIQERLSTQDKLHKWGVINSISCDFSRANVEDRNHLFFECQFTAGIWMRVLSLCGQSRLPRRSENEFCWATGCKGNCFCSVTKRIAWGATIYHLWRQRNARVHDNLFITFLS